MRWELGVGYSYVFFNSQLSIPCSLLPPHDLRYFSLSSLENITRYDQSHNLGSPFVDLGDSGIAEMSFHVVFLDISVSSMDLNGFGRDPAGRFGGEQLGHGRFFFIPLLLVFKERGPERQQPGGIH